MFADELSERIKAHTAFWEDASDLFARGMRVLLPRMDPPNHAPEELEQSADQRLIEAASILAQADSEHDKAIAQNIAFYSALVSRHPFVGEVAQNIIARLGNHPGAASLERQLKLTPTNLATYFSSRALRQLNTVQIRDKHYSLTDFQLRVWSSLKTPGTNVGISAPTSAGKSFVVLEFLCQEATAASSFTALFVAPTRALLGEVHAKITARLGEKASKEIRVSTVPTVLPQSKAPKQIFVLTQERLQVLLTSWSGTFDLVIVDEAQGIGDESRGMILQDCLEVLRTRGHTTRFLFLAPGAVGFENLTSAIDLPDAQVQATQLSPVVQNRVIVEVVPGDENRLALTLLSEDRAMPIGEYAATRGFANERTRLAAVALELGATGRSLVYGTGPADAEDTARQLASDLAEVRSDELKQLSSFIKKHVHRRYSLATHVLKGVGFHYGKMPGLLREALEQSFQNGDLKYLVCTTTLFQGVNLPARNVFIDTPTRGRGAELDAAALWNFAGRAGRLTHDIAGNVFLIGYNSWETKSLTTRVNFVITPSFRRTLTEQFDDVLVRLLGDAPKETPFAPYTAADAAAGLLISRAARGSLDAFLSRTVRNVLSLEKVAQLEGAAEGALDQLGLPKELLTTNWTVNPYGQARLLKRFREKIEKNDAEDLIPLFPSGQAYRRYVQIFSRINKYILANNSSRFSNRLASTGIAWMSGTPLPRLIDNYVKHKTKEDGGGKKQTGNVDGHVRNVFQFVEDILRFKYVQLGRAYVDLLRYAFLEAGKSDDAARVYDFPLALELGVSSHAGAVFIELGLSRISASFLENLIPDSNPSLDRAREWLHGLDPDEHNLSAIIVTELERKGLRKPTSA